MYILYINAPVPSAGEERTCRCPSPSSLPFLVLVALLRFYCIAHFTTSRGRVLHYTAHHMTSQADLTRPLVTLHGASYDITGGPHAAPALVARSRVARRVLAARQALRRRVVSQRLSPYTHHRRRRSRPRLVSYVRHGGRRSILLLPLLM